VFSGFVNPALVFGVALASVPLIIHLLNRQRFRPMPWAAMRFVVAAHKKTRRRANLENLLLLLLRMAAVALLALVVARPFLGDRSPLAQLAQSRRDVVLVLDLSASTGYRTGVRSVHEDIVERARAILLELDAGRDDRVRLIAAGAGARLLSWRRPDEALSLLSSLSGPDDEPLDLAAALGEVARLAEEDADRGGASSMEIRLLTDLQRASFEAAPAADGPARAPAVLEQLDRLAALDLEVWVEDLGPDEATPPNLSVAAIEPVGEILPGGTVEIAVDVRNHGATARNGVRVWLTVDADQRLPFRTLDVPARGSARAVFATSLQGAGPRLLTARIDSDRLAVDDTRARVVDVPATVDVLLVNGESAVEIERDEVGYLHSVLDPLGGDEVLGAGSTPPFAARVVAPHELGSAELDLATFDVIVVANVDGLSASNVTAFERWTASGGALIFTLGRRVEPTAFNLRLHRPDGSGLSPAELLSRSQIARRDGYFRVREFEATHPALSFFADERWKPLLTEAPNYEFFRSRPDENARVLARLDDEGASALLIEKRYDRGRVYLWTTSIDPEWSRIPESPRTFVPLVHEWLRHAARTTPPARNVEVGAPLIAEVRAFPRAPMLVAPDGTRRALDVEPRVEGPGLWSLSVLGATPRAGAYQLALEGAPAELFAVGLDALESDLDRLAPGELSGMHRAWALASEAEGDSDDAPAPTQGEVWRLLAWMCFAALCGETLWAAWVGRRRRTA
jgi:hypothetical protein